MARTFIGIDPGGSGGIAAQYCDDSGTVRSNLETIKLSETEADVADWLDRWSYHSPFAYLENVHSMPGQGVSSVFTFGQSLGCLRGMLIALRIPFELVTPMKWQAAMACRTRGDKNVSKARAQELFPELKVTHATADALLISEYGRRLLWPSTPSKSKTSRRTRR